MADNSDDAKSKRIENIPFGFVKHSENSAPQKTIVSELLKYSYHKKTILSRNPTLLYTSLLIICEQAVELKMYIDMQLFKFHRIDRV